MKICLLKRKLHKSNKRHFQLLEIMIAMLLIITCVAPALHIYMNMYKQESQMVHNYQADHLARLLHAEIVEKLYQNTIPFENILAGVEYPIENEGLRKIGFKGYYHLKIEKKKKEKKAQVADYLCSIKIFLENIQTKKKKEYAYLQFIQAPPPAGELIPEENIEDLNENDDDECEKEDSLDESD